MGVFGFLLLGISPSPYLVESPGPVYDTLGYTVIDEKEVLIINIEGAEEYPTDGHLDLLTVYLSGSPENPLNWFEVALAWLNPTQAILPREAVYPPGRTAEQASEESALNMRLSQQNAIAAALHELGFLSRKTVTVASVLTDRPADGVLRVGDEILNVNGQQITAETEIAPLVQALGVDAPITFQIRRDGVEQKLTLTTVPRSETDQTPIIGIAAGVSHVFPIDVDIALDSVGGPSAGMMFALAIYDRLTPGALTGGEHIAGTGTISAEGTVGPIGGIRQKLVAAKDAGARWFLAPVANCAEVVDHIPDGLNVFAVSSLTQAINLVETIGQGGDTTNFVNCYGV